jgi:hypothetical protein
LSADIVYLPAARTARLLRANAPPRWIAIFVAQMTDIARQQQDAAREAFWHEVGRLARREGAAPFAV